MSLYIPIPVFRGSPKDGVPGPPLSLDPAFQGHVLRLLCTGKNPVSTEGRHQASELNRVQGLGFMGEACPMSALNNGSKVIMGEALNMGADIGTIRGK